MKIELMGVICEGSLLIKNLGRNPVLLGRLYILCGTLKLPPSENSRSRQCTLKTKVRGFCTEMLVQVKTLSNKYKKLLLTPYRWTIGIG